MFEMTIDKKRQPGIKMHHIMVTAGFLVTLFLAGPALAAGPEVNELQFFTREQYRACLDSQEKLTAQRQTLDNAFADNNAMMLRIQADAKSLVDLQKSVSPYDESQIKNFNKRIEEHNSVIALANEQVVKLKADQEAYHAASLEHNKSCVGLMVKTADRDAVLQERQLAEKPQAGPARGVDTQASRGSADGQKQPVSGAP